jgi:hypothetical protein
MSVVCFNIIFTYIFVRTVTEDVPKFLISMAYANSIVLEFSYGMYITGCVWTIRSNLSCRNSVVYLLEFIVVSLGICGQLRNWEREDLWQKLYDRARNIYIFSFEGIIFGSVLVLA